MFLLDHLNDDIAAPEQAIADQSSGVGNHVAAGAAIDDAINRGTITVRQLDAIVRNKYAPDAGTLAEWTSASHTERAPRRSSTTFAAVATNASGVSVGHSSSTLSPAVAGSRTH